MSTKTPEKTAMQPRQEVRIDLPGEKVEVWLSGPKLLVTLRKHRDVILDFRLGNGKQYTAESTHSDFYNANTKKIILAKQKQTVSFHDGERLHLWVTRNFKGALLIKCGDKLMMKIEPNQLDHQQYDEHSKTKPAPIIIKLGAETPSRPALPHTAAWQKPVDAVPPPAHLMKPHSASIDPECSVVCVVEGKLAGAHRIYLIISKKVAEIQGWPTSI